MPMVSQHESGDGRGGTRSNRRGHGLTEAADCIRTLLSHRETGFHYLESSCVLLTPPDLAGAVRREALREIM